MKPTGWKAWAAYVAVAVSGGASVATSPNCPDEKPQVVDTQGPIRSVQLTADIPSQQVTVVVTTPAELRNVALSARLAKGTATAVHLSADGQTPAETPSGDAGATAVTMPLCPGGCSGAKKFSVFVIADHVAADDPAVVEFSASTRVASICGESVQDVIISYE
jgi:hypothetical protein